MKLNRLEKTLGLSSLIVTGSRPVSRKAPFGTRVIDWRTFIAHVYSSDRIIYHGASYFEYLDEVLSLPNPICLYYHNVTPAAFFLPWDPVAAQESLKAKSQILRRLEEFDGCLAPSTYSAMELANANIPVNVVPPYVDQASWSTDGNLAAKTPAQVLYVGRIVPHKRLDIAIKVTSYLNHVYNVPARLVVVSTPQLDNPYHRALMSLANDLKCDINFTGAISERRLEDLYASSTIYLSTSEHEGFGLPILEAMQYTPVLARAFGAVPEVAPEISLVRPDQSPRDIAATIASVIKQPALTIEMLMQQKHTVTSQFSFDVALKAYRKVLVQLGIGGGI